MKSVEAIRLKARLDAGEELVLLHVLPRVSFDKKRLPGALHASFYDDDFHERVEADGVDRHLRIEPVCVVVSRDRVRPEHAPESRDVAVQGGLRRARHIVARASLHTVEPVGPPDPPVRVAEAVRERIAAGGHVLDPRPRSLYLGLVLGDDRFQSAGQELRFRLSGLTHLLAVSGQNVAFVLAVVAPLLGRLDPRWRLATVALVLSLFAVITRLEPSVLRAVVTAGLSTWAATSGRVRSGLGVLAAAEEATAGEAGP